MVGAFIAGLMAGNMQGTDSWDQCMGKDSMSGTMDALIRDSTKVTKNMALESIDGSMAKNIMDSGAKDCSMGKDSLSTATARTGEESGEPGKGLNGVD